jgi:hypothetical protein
MGRKFILVVALQAGAAKFLTPPAQVERRRRMRARLQRAQHFSVFRPDGHQVLRTALAHIA